MRRRKRAEKVDLSNPDRDEVNAMIASYEAQGRREIPIRISEKLIVYVSLDKFNEKYLQRYLK